MTSVRVAIRQNQGNQSHYERRCPTLQLCAVCKSLKAARCQLVYHDPGLLDHNHAYSLRIACDAAQSCTKPRGRAKGGERPKVSGQVCGG